MVHHNPYLMLWISMASNNNRKENPIGVYYGRFKESKQKGTFRNIR